MFMWMFWVEGNKKKTRTKYPKFIKSFLVSVYWVEPCKEHFARRSFTFQSNTITTVSRKKRITILLLFLSTLLLFVIYSFSIILSKVYIHLNFFLLFRFHKQITSAQSPQEHKKNRSTHSYFFILLVFSTFYGQLATWFFKFRCCRHGFLHRLYQGSFFFFLLHSFFKKWF